jgi:hypothetical protein
MLVKPIHGPRQLALSPHTGGDSLTEPTLSSGSEPMADDFRVYAAKPVTTRPPERIP